MTAALLLDPDVRGRRLKIAAYCCSTVSIITALAGIQAGIAIVPLGTLMRLAARGFVTRGSVTRHGVAYKLTTEGAVLVRMAKDLGW
jgi:hypothetical protein